LTMQHAGVSITVTSMTDVFAFIIGMTSTFPTLRWFCLSSAIAISAIFMLQSSWLVAWLTLDQRRIEQRQNGFLPCIKHEDWKPSRWSQKDLEQKVTNQLSALLQMKPIQAAIVAITLGCLGMGAYGTLNIRISFDQRTLLPSDGYLTKFIDVYDEQYPSDGHGVTVYADAIAYDLETFEKLALLVDSLHEHIDSVVFLSYVEKTVLLGNHDLSTGFWWDEFKEYIEEHKRVKVGAK
jgi:Niemann-Pick C1 protein